MYVCVEVAPYFPSGAVSESPQLIKPTVSSLYRQHRHCHADQRRTLRCGFTDTDVHCVNAPHWCNTEMWTHPTLAAYSPSSW